MQTEVPKKLFTIGEYYRMAETGILRPDERVELIDGEIVQMSPIGHRHAVRVTRATRLFVQALGGRAVVSIQNPLQLSDYSEPQPDIVVLKPQSDDYASRKWTTEDVLFVVEVSETSFRYDRTIKLPRYAAAGIPEVWIENLEADELLVYRNPSGTIYSLTLTLRRGDSVSPTSFPDVVFPVDELLV